MQPNAEMKDLRVPARPPDTTGPGAGGEDAPMWLCVCVIVSVAIILWLRLVVRTGVL